MGFNMEFNVKGRSLRAAALAALLATVLILPLAGCSRSGAGTVTYESAVIRRGNLEQHVTATGTLSAVVSVDVGSQVSGKVSALNVDFNSKVKKGELIAEIDPSVYVAQLKQAEGNLASAKATVVLDEENLKREKALVPLKAASQLDLDQAVAQLAQARADVEVKQAAVDSARTNLSYCKITSPVDGVVISRKVDVGQTVAAAFNTPVLFTIAQDITKMHISAAVSEADIGHVKVGQSVQFTVDAFPDEVFHGKVSQVRMAPTTTQNVVTYETIIDVNNPERKLFPGMTADVSILVARHDNVLEIPNAALRYTPPPNARFSQPPPRKLARGERLAYALEGQGKELKPLVLKVGISDGVNTEILSGASAGEHVVTSNLSSAPPRRRGPFPPP